MKADDKKLLNLFTGYNTRYSIPVYQRKYSWEIQQCRQLWNDVRLLIGNKKTHFFGSVVRLSDEYEHKQIIDGQQRLTTVSLLLLALLQLIRDDKKESSRTVKNNIESNLWFDKDDNTQLSRIEHVDSDAKAYSALIEGEKNKYDNSSSMTINFRYFYHEVLSADYSLEDIYDAINRLVIADVQLSSNDDPQEVFESLNSTGLALSDGDKIRNFMLMNLEPFKQKEYYCNYWVDIEKYSNYTNERKNARFAVTSFVRDYMTTKTTHIPRLNEVYYRFKEYTDKWKGETEGLLRDMKKYSRYLYQLENGDTNDTGINNVLKRIALLEMTVLHPFELNILDDYYNEVVSAKEIISLLELVEIFIFRRLMCEVPTNALNKIFATLYGMAKNLSTKENISFYDATAYILTSKTDSGRFPNDNEFREALATKNVYKMRAKNKIYLFYRLNSGKSLEGDTSVIDKMQQDKDGKTILSIEHIMPQTLSRKWIEDLGGEEKAHKLQERWEHTISNLTLTAYNSPYSNSSFKDKLEYKDENGVGIGFKYSPLYINNFVKEQIEWGEEQLNKRLKLIQRDATTIIWPMPYVTYKPKVKMTEELALNDDNEDFTGKYFIDGTINGISIPEKPYRNWKAVFITIMKILNKEYHFDLVGMANDESQSTIQNDKTKINGSTLLFDGMYVYLSTSTATKMDMLKDIFDYIGLNQDSLVFHVKSDNKDENVQQNAQ